AHDGTREGVDACERRVVHPRPDRGGEDDREPEEDQAQAVTLVVRVQVPRVAAEPADDAAYHPRHQDPGHRDDPEQPGGERDEEVGRGRARGRRALPARAALSARRPAAAAGLAAAGLAAAGLAAAGLARARGTGSPARWPAGPAGRGAAPPP